MRLFVAAKLPEEIEDALAENLAELKQLVAGNPVPPGSFHATLAFLGEVPGQQVAAVIAALEAACAEHRSFDVELDDYGSFGRKEAAVLWQGFADEYELSQLADSVRYELQLRGLDYDDKPFAAHVTLMRKAELAETELPAPYGGAGEVSCVQLLQTVFENGRPRYELVHQVELAGSLPPRMQQGRALFIDADACPVTAEALACARAAKIPAVIAGNSTQNLERHIRKTDPRQPRQGFWVTTLAVGVGADAADFAIVQQLQPCDVVVTQDIGLASMVLGRGAKAIGVRGREYSPATIDSAMQMRHVEKKIRRQGGRTQGPAAFTSEDRARFTRNLQRMLAE